MKAKFVVCTRKNSRRVPNKPFVKINGKPIIEHLLDRLTDLINPVFLAIPEEDWTDYIYLKEKYGEDVILFIGDPLDPLKRMTDCCLAYGIDHAIRVSHDKIFVREEQVFEALDFYMAHGLDYLYSTHQTDGTGFEIISTRSLLKASRSFDKVEHISYAIKAITDNSQDYVFDQPKTPYRLLIDFPEDITLLETIFATLGNSCSFKDVLKLLIENPYLVKINKLPDVTVYTCALNAASSINTVMNSVAEQKMPLYKTMEYILVDDFSSDLTPLMMAEYTTNFKFAKFFRNSENLGLASSSNKALSHARGKHIIRIDADDYFVNKRGISTLLEQMEKRRDLDVIYPGYYDGSMHRVGDPKTHHHPAGALFKTRALNHIKFTDKLRHYDGLDLYMRAKEQLNIGYLNQPIFFYTHRDGSLSRGGDPERAKIKEQILATAGEEC